MLPNVQIGDRVLVDRLAYRLGEPKRGDVVVFRFPYPWNDMNLIKRVIGLPGDIVAIQPGIVLVNGHSGQRAISSDIRSNMRMGPARVPTGEYFVLGDNRPVSYDSHQWGFLPATTSMGG